jgi:GPH family glycoside/pentoside/hexuronide:cation symporter
VKATPTALYFFAVAIGMPTMQSETRQASLATDGVNGALPQVPFVSEGGRGLSRLGLGQKIAYGTGSMVEGITTQAIGLFLFFYATAVCGLPSALAGLALAVGLVVDAIVDPLIGSTSDGWHSKLGRRLPFMLVGFPIAAVSLILLFSLPEGFSHTGLFLWLSFISIVLRIALSLFLLPYNAAGAELSDDYAERSSIAAWRWGAQMVAGLTVVVLGFGVFFSGEGGLSRRAAYAPFGEVLAAALVAVALIASRAVYVTRDRQHSAPHVGQRRHLRFAAEIAEMFKSQSFRVIFIGSMILFTGLSINFTLSIHANKYFWGLNTQQIQTVTMALFIGLIFGAPLAGPMLKVMQKRTVLIIGEVGLGLAYATPVVLRLMGLFPFTGGKLAMILAGVMFAGGVLMAAAAIAFASMMADAADEHEFLFGARREGLYFAGWSFALKAAAGLGSLFAGVGLQFIGFDSASQAGGATVKVAPQTVEWLGVLFGIGSGALALVAASLCLLYRLTSHKHGAILLELEARRTLSDTPLPIAV